MPPTNLTATVIVSLYNSEPHLDRLFAGLRSLDLRGHQLILIDDASTDETVAQVRASEFAQSLEVNQNNLGIAGTRNRALSLATGDYVLLLDHDDEWHPQLVQKLLELAAEFDADIAICAADFVDGRSGRKISSLEAPRRRAVYTRAEAVHFLLNGTHHGYTWNKLIRRSIMPLDAYQTIYSPKEDLARLLLTLVHCERIATTPELLYRHLDFPSAMTRQMHQPLGPYERCYQLGLDLAAAAGVTDRALLRYYRYYQYIGPSVGTALSRDAFSPENVALLARARKLTRWRDLPGAFVRFPLETTLAFAHKVFGLRLRAIYRVLRPVLPHA